MALRHQTLPESTKRVQQTAMRYCESADRNLKIALLAAERNINQAKQEFQKHEEETCRISKKYGSAEMSKIMDAAKSIVDSKKPNTDDFKPSELEDLYKYYVPYVQKMNQVAARTDEFELIKQKIEINADIYTLYRSEVEQ